MDPRIASARVQPTELESDDQEAIDFVRKYDGTAQGRLRGMLNAAQVETCSEPLLRAGKEAARELGVPIHTHAGGNLVEFERIMAEYRKTPIQFLADIGFLDKRTLLGHAVFTTAHPWPRYPFGDDLRVLAQTGATVGHCPYKYAKMAMTLHSLSRYLAAGVTIALGTDTYPLDIVSELRWASILAKVTDANYQAGLPRDVFNAATLGGTKFIDRPDLGRLAPGAKCVLKAAYRSQGLDNWKYTFSGANAERSTSRDNAGGSEKEISQARDFHLLVKTDFSGFDFPDNSLSPTEKRQTANGWELEWNYQNLVSGFDIALKMPQKLQPGPLAGEISFFAPVSLFFFFFLMFSKTSSNAGFGTSSTTLPNIWIRRR